MHGVCRLIALLLLIAGTASCSDDKITQFTPPGIDEVYWSLNTDIDATTIALNGTQQLVTTPRNRLGQPIRDLPRPRYWSTDEQRITVDSNGLVTGKGVTVSPSTGVYVFASLSARGVTHTDSTLVVVTPQSAVIRTFELTADGGSRFGYQELKRLNLEVRDADGDSIPGLATALRLSDHTKAMPFYFMDTWHLYGQGIGKVRAVVSATHYGVSVSDSLDVVVQFPTTASMNMSQQHSSDTVARFVQKALAVGVNARVTWMNFSPLQVDVIFENNLENIQGGNIGPLGPGGSATRTFLAPGTYWVRNGTTGERAKVIVYAQPEI
jgi:hypothetical protein